MAKRKKQKRTFTEQEKTIYRLGYRNGRASLRKKIHDSYLKGRNEQRLIDQEAIKQANKKEKLIKPLAQKAQQIFETNIQLRRINSELVSAVKALDTYDEMLEKMVRKQVNS